MIWAVRVEMARSVEDVLARRCRALFLNAKAAVEMAPEVARLMAAELGEGDEWQRRQLAAFEETAALLPAVLASTSARGQTRGLTPPAGYDDRLWLVAVWPRVIALNAIVRTQQTTIVMKTPFQPQWSAIQPTPVPAIADPKT